jgi:hypothetical protein
MQKLLYLGLFLGLYETTHASLFFWQNQEKNIFALHYNSYDICIDGGVCTGYNHQDRPLFVKYIYETLLPNQNEAVTILLKQLLALLMSYSIHIPYKRDFYSVVNQIKPVSSLTTTNPVATAKPLSADEKKEQIVQVLASLGLARPVNMPQHFKAG